jgi:hypothetical protein
MAETEKKIRLLDPSSYFTSPTETTIVDDVNQEILDQEPSVLKAEQIRDQEDWSFLASKVVGAEGE